MTERANRLIDRATDPRGSAPAMQTNTAREIRVFVDALARLGYDIVPLLAGAGLRRADLDDPDGRLPCAITGTVLGLAMQQRPMKNLGMRIATATPIGAFPMIDYL